MYRKKPAIKSQTGLKTIINIKLMPKCVQLAKRAQQRVRYENAQWYVVTTLIKFKSHSPREKERDT